MQLEKRLQTLEDSYLREKTEQEKDNLAERIWSHDVSLWPTDEAGKKEISARLGWLDIAERLLPEARNLMEWAEKLSKNKVHHVFLLGMGGSALAAEVMAQILPRAEGFPELTVLDTTDPEDIANAAKNAEEGESLFITASKSGSTVEMKSLMHFFLDHYAPSRFIAITDEGSALQTFAEEQDFERIFLNDANIGGRFSALSYFGLVPAALCGIDIEKFLGRAVEAMPSLKKSNANENSGLDLGIFMGSAAKEGRDKLRLALPDSLMSFGLWIEQLVAESSGKNGKGIVPLPLSNAEAWTPKEDETWVQVSITEKSPSVDAPTISESWSDPFDLGASFLHWEFAISVACHVLQVNTFDQPNVQDAKVRAKEALKSLGATKGERGFSVRKSSDLSSNYANVGEAIEDLVQKSSQRSYTGILAFLPTSKGKVLEKIRQRVEEKTQRPCSLQFGPRYLHSTGQLHKGGANEGLFLVLRRHPEKDLNVPGETYTFGQLQRAQAIGDFEALMENGRTVVLVDLSQEEDLSH